MREKEFIVQNYLPVPKNRSSFYRDVYVFDCSLRQAFNYFFSFGADAEILSPDELRNEFIENYSSALTIYR